MGSSRLLPVVAQFEFGMINGVIPSAAVFQAERGISRLDGLHSWQA
jgi:hypothetical protein